MKITFLLGATATKVGDKKPTRFYGGETENIIDDQAESLIAQNVAGKPGSKAVKEAVAAIGDGNPRTRRQDLEAKTPGLEARLMAKGIIPQKTRKSLKELGVEANGGKDADGRD